ncbi:30S ribosomal protein S2 [Candidatus Amesbacteria bacterium RIFCSPHIGHO2_01_FULL_48_32]|uniref:Small ribosomal subunit protein uS2 n=1 Tax=Candidatus Amesbacteria bacterium RIFCSPLOWO2_01_FULL_48_25 TaxID=1797259 RepID=A0A1F4ZB97_9BACT|nr:MAG: 30S ribosomal protein S2 [Candidatus Amesbacteria bacterium RIFCSPHIGHO2_01_FULL_48_32]OGD03650.1 MAG: 30S ribosomal protein S2 [Candidatus Amesbacteria bacterium RIFCSPLOWO2_01_FULL_48_25]
MSGVSLKDLLEAGCHFGHQSRRWNPAMAKYIYTARDGVHILDLAQTKKGIEEAAKYLGSMASEGRVILFVGTKRQAQEVVRREAVRLGMPYVTARWIGGLLTNWEQVQKRLAKLADLKDKRNRGDFKVYTKREQLLLDREIAKLEKFFGGVSTLSKLPDVLFVVDSHREEVAVKEARRMNIPVVALVDTNGDPALIDYVIPVNDDAVKSVELVVTAIADAIAGSKPQISSNKQESSPNE